MVQGETEKRIFEGMTPEQQRVAIAEACGHKDIGQQLIAAGTGMDQWVWCSGILGSGGYEILDYLNDLNAMHEAEKTLSDSEWLKYMSCLNQVCSNQQDRSRQLFHTTASQRAEPFLKAKGLLK